jgi:hypothetical protein
MKVQVFHRPFSPFTPDFNAIDRDDAVLLHSDKFVHSATVECENVGQVFDLTNKTPDIDDWRTNPGVTPTGLDTASTTPGDFFVMEDGSVLVVGGVGLMTRDEVLDNRVKWLMHFGHVVSAVLLHRAVKNEGLRAGKEYAEARRDSVKNGDFK